MASRFPQEIDSPEFNAALEEHERLASLKTHVTTNLTDYMNNDTEKTISSSTSTPEGSEWSFFDYLSDDEDYSTLMKKDADGNWVDFEGNVLDPYDEKNSLNRKTTNGDPTMNYEGLDTPDAGSLFERMMQGLKAPEMGAGIPNQNISNQDAPDSLLGSLGGQAHNNMTTPIPSETDPAIRGGATPGPQMTGGTPGQHPMYPPRRNPNAIKKLGGY